MSFNIPEISNIIPNIRDNVFAAAVPNLIGTQHATIIKTIETATETINFYGDVGAKLYFDWGDGTQTSITLNGDAIYIPATHDYGGASGEKTIRITGELSRTDAILHGGGGLTEIHLVGLGHLYRLVVDHNSSLAIIDSDQLLTKLFQNYVNDCALTNISFATNSTGIGKQYLYNNPVIYTSTTWAKHTGGLFYLNNALSTAAEVDQVLIDIAAAGFTGVDIYLDGTNPARTAASDAAVVTLTLAGCTLHLN